MGGGLFLAAVFLTGGGLPLTVVFRTGRGLFLGGGFRAGIAFFAPGAGEAVFFLISLTSLGAGEGDLWTSTFGFGTNLNCKPAPFDRSLTGVEAPSSATTAASVFRVQ